MFSAALMLHRLRNGIREALELDGFRASASAAVFLILIGTLTYSLTQGWSLVDGFYFSVCMLTTSTMTDPSLSLQDPGIKLFTSFYILLGIGILVSVVAQIGRGFVLAREKSKQHKKDKQAK